MKEDKTCVQGSLDDNRAIASGLAAQISSNPQLDIIRLPQDSSSNSLLLFTMITISRKELNYSVPRPNGHDLRLWWKGERRVITDRFSFSSLFVILFIFSLLKSSSLFFLIALLFREAYVSKKCSFFAVNANGL